MTSRDFGFRILHFAIGTVLLTLVLRTWLLMGLIEPVTVAGSSMVPTLRGSHVEVICAKCNHHFEVGSEFNTERIECLACGFAKNELAGLPLQHADHLLIDRTAFQFRHPRRWEPVVFRSPDGAQLTVKRVVGLPGEKLVLIGGDVWINDQISAKDLRTLRATRQLIHEEHNENKRWHSEAGNGWTRSDAGWRLTAQENLDDWQWLGYQHPKGQPITDETAYNTGFMQRLYPVRDLALSARIDASGKGSVAFQIEGYGRLVCSNLSADDGLLEVFAFDQHPQVFVDGRLVESRLSADLTHMEPMAPFAIGARDIHVTLKELRLYHDIYHASQNEDRGLVEPMTPIVLRTDEIFVLGDNVPISLDSRLWGPVSLDLLVGKPVGVR